MDLLGSSLMVYTMGYLMSNKSCPTPPNECPNENITFWLYTDYNTSQEISVSSLNITRNSNPWKMTIHGYSKSRFEVPNPQLLSAYFQNGSYNIIVLDYKHLAPKGCYVEAVKNVALIANCTAQLLDALILNYYLSSLEVHVIGFSLGAHIAGRINEFLKNGKLGRVTGLDPAGPLFDGSINPRLSPASAFFVDAIHTNALFKGMSASVGHIDFYPNGGYVQPGCWTQANMSFNSCNHRRSVEYYSESISTKVGFWAYPCPGYWQFIFGLCNPLSEEVLVLMGEYTPLTAKGTYYLNTNYESPYALGKPFGTSTDYEEDKDYIGDGSGYFF